MPQWNCACWNCFAARAGKIPARTQSSVAISADGERWFLVNASPDLRAQIEAFPPLQPHPTSPRNTPIAGVLLTNADLDHTLGLVLLREGKQIDVYATAAVRESLEAGLHFDALLNAFGGIRWKEPTSEFMPLAAEFETESDLTIRAIALPGGPPPFARSGTIAETGHSIAYQITDTRSGGRLLIAPDVASVTPELKKALAESDCVLFDGTFWSEEELRRVNPAARTAQQMGHMPIQGGSLEVLRPLPARKKIYLHINNTNPILAPASPERAVVERAGVAVGEDGMEFEL